MPFLLFILSFTLLISLLFTASTTDDKLTYKTFSDYLISVSRLEFGDFDIEGYSPLEQAIFVIAVIAIPLILLNMLIALLGDTYDRAK